MTPEFREAREGRVQTCEETLKRLWTTLYERHAEAAKIGAAIAANLKELWYGW